METAVVRNLLEIVSHFYLPKLLDKLLADFLPN